MLRAHAGFLSRSPGLIPKLPSPDSVILLSPWKRESIAAVSYLPGRSPKSLFRDEFRLVFKILLGSYPSTPMDQSVE